MICSTTEAGSLISLIISVINISGYFSVFFTSSVETVSVFLIHSHLFQVAKTVGCLSNSV